MIRTIVLLLALTGCNDRDKDGFGKDVDCDDRNAAVYPGAPELCDGLDNDCNGQIDEVLTAWHQDADLDGYGDMRASVVTCAAPPGYVADGTDCDDSDAKVHPGATELCNSRDDDCDGHADDGVESTWYPDSDGDG